MIDLNDVQSFAEIDKQGMLAHALNLPRTCVDAWKLAAHAYPQMNLAGQTGLEPLKLNQIVIVGMGGSAIGGDLLAALVADECPCPVFVHRGYDLPASVKGRGTLVVGSSHSGNTEETLSSFQKAHERGAQLLALTAGGELGRLAADWNVPLLRFSYDSQPRAALGYSFTLLVSLLCHLGLIADKGDDLVEAAQVMHAWQAEIGPDVPVARNPAKLLAGQLTERMPVVYGAGPMEPVARRWKTQFNENAKRWAFFEAMPELNHNAVVGFEMSERIREWANVIVLRPRYESSRMRARWRITRRMLRHEGVGQAQVEAQGESRLAQMLSLIHFGDLVSIYLALATNVDPTPVAPIAYLKDELAKS